MLGFDKQEVLNGVIHSPSTIFMEGLTRLVSLYHLAGVKAAEWSHELLDHAMAINLSPPLISIKFLQKPASK